MIFLGPRVGLSKVAIYPGLSSVNHHTVNACFMFNAQIVPNEEEVGLHLPRNVYGCGLVVLRSGRWVKRRSAFINIYFDIVG